jgi:hypothetical protein
MLTLDDIKEYYEKGLIELRLDFYPPHGTAKGKKLEKAKWMAPCGLSCDQTRQVLFEKKLTIVLEQEVIVFEKKCFRMETEKEEVVFDLMREGCLSVSIERGHIKDWPWEKIKKQMREAEFAYRSESPWHHTWEKGRWERFPFG